MSNAKVTSGITISLDGFAAGLNQSFEKPFGDKFDSDLLDRWMFAEPEKHKHKKKQTPFLMRMRLSWVAICSGPKTEGGTTYIFVTDGIESTLSKAKEAAGNRDVKIMGGANILNQYLAAGLMDELPLHIAPVTIGEGSRLFEGVPNLNLEPIEVSGTSMVTHIRYRFLK